METAIGTLVRSKAGRDKGKLLVIVSACGDTVSVCDGKERPLERPKRKNAKHIERLPEKLSPENMRSNRAIRKSLRAVACAAPRHDEEVEIDVKTGYDRN